MAKKDKQLSRGLGALFDPPDPVFTHGEGLFLLGLLAVQRSLAVTEPAHDAIDRLARKVVDNTDFRDRMPNGIPLYHRAASMMRAENNDALAVLLNDQEPAT